MKEIIIRMKSGNDVINKHREDGIDNWYDIRRHETLEVECDGVIYRNLLGAEIKVAPPYFAKEDGRKPNEPNNWLLDINLKHYMQNAEGY